MQSCDSTRTPDNSRGARMNQNPLELAGASQEASRPEPNPDTAREIHPVILEKDYLDFRPKSETDVEEAIAPKSSLVPVSVASPTSPTGLEDVSEEDLGTDALPNAEKDRSQQSSPPSENGSQTS
jgi:hypothetical protein